MLVKELMKSYRLCFVSKDSIFLRFWMMIKIFRRGWLRRLFRRNSVWNKFNNLMAWNSTNWNYWKTLYFCLINLMIFWLVKIIWIISWTSLIWMLISCIRLSLSIKSLKTSKKDSRGPPLMNQFMKKTWLVDLALLNMNLINYGAIMIGTNYLVPDFNISIIN